MKKLEISPSYFKKEVAENMSTASTRKIRNDIREKIEELSNKEIYFDRQVDFSFRQFADQYGVLPPENQLSIYITNLFKKISNDSEVEVFVCEHWNSINACAFPNKKIFISLPLIEIAETEEELLYVLHHELSHIENEHSKKRFEEAIKDPGNRDILTRIKNFLEMTGMARSQEYEADKDAYVKLDEKGVNSIGGILFNEKMMKQDKCSNGDMVHGSTVDRLINNLWGAKLYDLKYLSEKNLTMMPNEIKKYPQEGKSKYKLLFSKDDIFDVILHQKRIKAVDQCTPLTMIELLPFLYEEKKNILQNIEINQQNKVKNHSWLMAQKRNDEIIQPLVSILEKEIESTPGLNWQEKELSLATIMILIYNIPLLTEKIPMFDYSKYLLDNIESLSDWDLMIKVIRKTCQHLQLPLIKNPKELVLIVIDNFFQNGVFLNEENSLQIENLEQFFDKVIFDLQNLYSEFGLNAIDIKELKLELYLQALEEVCEEDDEAINNFINNIIDQNIADKNSIIKKLNNIGYEKEEINNWIKNDYTVMQTTLALKNDEVKIDSTQEIVSENLSLEEIIGSLEKAVDVKTILDIFYKSEKIIDFDIITKEKFFRLINVLKNLKNKVIENQKIDPEYDTDEVASFLIDFVDNYIRPKMKENCSKLEIISILKDIAIDYTNFSEMFSDFYLDFCDNQEELLQMYNIAFSSKISPNDNENYENQDLEINYYFEYSVYVVINHLFSQNRPLSEIMEIFTNLQNNIKMKNRSLIKLRNTFIENDKDDGIDYDLPRYTNINNMAEIKKQFFQNFLDNLVLNNIHDTSILKNLYQLSFSFSDVAFATRVQEVIGKELTHNSSFEEMFAFIFGDEKNKKNSTSIVAIEPLIEEKATTHSQIKKCKDKVIKAISVKDSSKGLGTLAVLEQLIDKKDTNELFFDLLETYNNDLPLRKRLFDSECAIKESLGKDYKSTPCLEIRLQQLYRLDQKAKYIILRKLLLGPKGVLSEKSQSKTKLLDYFFSNYTDTKEDDSVSNSIKEVLREFIEKGEIRHTYFAVVNLLLDKILKIPQKKCNNEDQWDNISKEFLNNKFSARDYYENAKIKKEEKEKERKELQAMCYQKNEIVSDAEIAFINKVYDLFSNQFAEKEVQKISSTELVVEIAKRLGAVGVRFLQIMGQYMEIPKELEDGLNEAYDNINGQSKLAAHTTVKKEWNNFEDQITEIFASIGGGSMTTVYKTKTKDGNMRVLKVLNPSFQYNLETTYEMLLKIFNNLAKKDPHKYNIAIPVLDDIRKWIEKDMNFSDFLEKDANFYKQWNGFKIKGNEYAIKIPQSFGPDNAKFKQEEFVEGTNLTDIDKLEASGHNLKAIIALIIQHYVAQIKKGIVHSDVHIGNFRVTEDKKVTVLDRNFYLEFDMNDKLFIRDIVNNVKNPDKLAKKINKYLIRFNEKLKNNPITDDLNTYLIDEKSEDVAKVISSVMIFLRKHNLEIPLEITLLVKNFNALDKMAKTVGLNFVELFN